MHEIVASRVDWRLGRRGGGGGGVCRKAIAIASYRFVLAAAKRAAKSKMLGVLKWSGSWQCSVQCTVESRKEVQWVGRDFDLHKKWCVGCVNVNVNATGGWRWALFDVP